MSSAETPKLGFRKGEPRASRNMTEPFAHYDSRGYRTVDVAAGYAAWAPFYDATMDDRLDLPLLASLASLDWSGITAAVDLACGIGRIGAWLKARGVARVDGVDASAAMLERAAAKGDLRSIGLCRRRRDRVGGRAVRSRRLLLCRLPPRRPRQALRRGTAP